MENPSINGWFGCTSILGNLHMIICFPGYTETFFLHPFFALHNHHEVTLPCSKSPWSLDTLRNCRLGSKSPRSANSQCLTKKITLFSIFLLRKSCFHIAPSKLSVGISYRIYLRRRIPWFIIFPKVQSLFSQKKKLDESNMMRTSDSNPTLLVCWQSSIHFWLT